jgi:hypothetical protein
MAFSHFGITEPLNSGYDFYTADAAINIEASLSASLTVADTDVLRILIASADISGSLSVSASVIKIAKAEIVITNILTTTLDAVFERQDGDVVMSANVSVACNATKISYAGQDALVNVSSSELTVDILRIAIASASISPSLSVDQVPFLKISKANSDISANATVSSNASRIAFIAAAFSSHLDLSIAGKLFLMTIRINVLNNLSVLGSMIRYSANTSVGQDTSLIRNYILIDNKAITNHNRDFGTSIEPIFIENKNWDNYKSRYYKSTARGGRRTFDISWSYLPNSKNATVDGNEGRDVISSIAKDPDYHVLKISNMDAVGTTPDTETSYNVLVKSYSETLVRRDFSSDTYYWDCQITLEEV